MARRIPGPKPGAIIEFRPIAYADPMELEPVKIFVRAPSQGEKREHLYAMLELSRSAEAAGKSLGMREHLASKRDVIERFVTRVENYSDQSGVAIDGGDALWERGEDLLCSEVYVFLLSLLSLEPEAKNVSGASSSSSPVETPVSPGIASSATHDAPTSETATA
jgi:2-hydroxychromene-2-carboxylate isomerase